MFDQQLTVLILPTELWKHHQLLNCHSLIEILLQNYKWSAYVSFVSLYIKDKGHIGQAKKPLSKEMIM